MMHLFKQAEVTWKMKSVKSKKTIVIFKIIISIEALEVISI